MSSDCILSPTTAMNFLSQNGIHFNGNGRKRGLNSLNNENNGYDESITNSNVNEEELFSLFTSNSPCKRMRTYGIDGDSSELFHGFSDNNAVENTNSTSNSYNSGFNSYISHENSNKRSRTEGIMSTAVTDPIALESKAKDKQHEHEIKTYQAKNLILTKCYHVMNQKISRLEAEKKQLLDEKDLMSKQMYEKNSKIHSLELENQRLRNEIMKSTRNVMYMNNDTWQPPHTPTYGY